jgi:hypothetical protein
VVVVVYDGTRFQVVSQLNSAGNATFANVSITSALNVGGVATFTANPVLSGGTANGVLYLNGSKVATSGTGLVFDGARLLLGTTTTTTSSTQSGEVYSTGAVGFLLTANTAGNYALSVKNEGTSGTRRLINFYEGTGGGTSRANISFDGSNGIALTVGSGTTTFDSSGNLGIGTTSPGCRLNATQAASAALGAQIALHNNAATAVGNAVEIALLTDGGASPSGIRNGRIRAVNENVGSGAANMQFWTWSGSTDAERARITSGGALLVGATSNFGAADDRLQVDTATASARSGIFRNNTSTTDTVGVWNSATTGDNLFIQFYTEAGASVRGSINYNRAGGLVAYNTTSDYRAKDILGPVQNSGATIDALKVYEGQMKGATQSRPMLVAHEAQEHAPYAVTGEKDAVNEDGTPKYQQMDVSALVPLLLAEIQSLRARVAQLETK